MMRCSPRMSDGCFGACSTIWGATSKKPSARITAVSRIRVPPTPPASRPSPNTPAASSSTPPRWTTRKPAPRVSPTSSPRRFPCQSRPQRPLPLRRLLLRSRNNPGAAPTTELFSLDSLHLLLLYLPLQGPRPPPLSHTHQSKQHGGCPRFAFEPGSWGCLSLASLFLWI